MKPIENFYENNTPAAADNAPSFQKLISGKYVAVITAIEAHENEGYLDVTYDIAEGPFAGYYSRQMQRFSWVPNTQRVYFTARSVAFFRRFIEAITESNEGFEWNWDENSLVGKIVGIVLNSEEYKKKDGGIGTRLRIDSWVPVSSLDEVEMPEPRKLKSTTTETTEASEDFPPFGRGVPLNLEEGDSGELPF